MKSGLERYETKEFRDWIKDVFLRIQKAWNDNRPEDLINVESSFLLERDLETLSMYKAEGKREIRKDVLINYLNLFEYNKFENREILKVTLKASMENYLLDLNTNEILEGTRDYKKTNKYILTLGRNLEDNNAIIKCIGCGAMVDLHLVRACEYCNTVVDSNIHGWLVEDIEVFDEDKKKYTDNDCDEDDKYNNTNDYYFRKRNLL